MFILKNKCMKITQIVGIDVSKLTLDAHHHNGAQKSHIANNSKGHKGFLRWLKGSAGKKLQETMVVMEHTGYYSYRFEQFLQQNGVSYCKRPALDIKRSCGMTRGKSDKADAAMISRYGWMRREELEPSQPAGDTWLELKQLMAHRDKLVADRASYQCRVKELKWQLGDKLAQHVVTSTEWLMEVLATEIKQTEAQIRTLVKEDAALNANYILVKSVCGIGFVTTVHFLIATENFTRFSDPRKFACYCGVAPFEHRSGTSIRGKTKTSPLANRKIKYLLTMAAGCAIQHDPELKEKYRQKIKEGKAKMSALNIIRAKLIERIFAVIRKKTLYTLKIAA